MVRSGLFPFFYLKNIYFHICSKSKKVLIEGANAIYIDFKTSQSKEEQTKQETAKQLKNPKISKLQLRLNIIKQVHIKLKVQMEFLVLTVSFE